MAEKKKGKKRKEEYHSPGEEVIEKPSKEEYSIAKWMRKNVPIKKTKFLNHNVKYFTASRAIDALLTPNSPWSAASGSTTTTPFFHTRDDVVDYLHRMLEHKFFHRARKVPVSDQELAALRGGVGSVGSGDKKKSAVIGKIECKEEGSKDGSGGGKEAEKGGKGTDAESSVVEGNGTGSGGNKGEQTGEKEKRKRKVRLDMHNDQRFIDSLNAYVWIYDPIPLHYLLMGAIFVLGAIGLCLFPLWPPSVRLAVYYLSVAAAGFLVFIILLVVLRLIVFCTVWLVTMGKHHLWILPNLTEDVGFFASFWPLYKHEYKGILSSGKKSKKKKKDKDSDAEDNDKDDESIKLLTDDAISEQVSEKRTGDRLQQQQQAIVENVPPTPPSAEAHTPITGNNSESESESSSQRSSTGKDFEMVEEGDLDDEDDVDDDDDDDEERHDEVKKA